jgi:hypothetical protein
MAAWPVDSTESRTPPGATAIPHSLKSASVNETISPHVLTVSNTDAGNILKKTPYRIDGIWRPPAAIS